MKRALVAGMMCVLVFAWRAEAQAQGTADTVILHDGTLVRGTIVEVRPDDYVVIQTATGETRRFESDQVRYAGPSDQAPSASVGGGGTTPYSPPAPYSAPPPGSAPSPAQFAPPPVSNGDLPIRIVDEGEGLTLRLQTGSAYGMSGGYAVQITTYRTVCTAPCVGGLPEGVHQFAVMTRGGRDYAVRGTVQVSAGSELVLGIERHRRARGIMAGVGFGLALGGFLAMGMRIGNGYDFLDGGVTAGYAVGAAGLLIGVFGLVFIRNRGRITVRPASLTGL